jgi:hypothetical protein
LIGSQWSNDSKGEEQEKENESFHYLEFGFQRAIGWERQNAFPCSSRKSLLEATCRENFVSGSHMKFLKIFLIVATVAFLAFVAFVVWFGFEWAKGEERAQQRREDLRSGKEDFGDQPALFSVAQAIVQNDPGAIRVAAKNLPDLQAAGRTGKTLLYFAVGQTWHQEHRVEAVKTLLSLGADPNYNNGQEYSFALVQAGQAAAPVLRVMLEGGGDPNGRDKEGVPLILLNWRVSYYTDSQSRARLDLLLDRGADINSTMPETGWCCPGYTVLLYRTSMAFDDENVYADALHLLERGADLNRVAPDGMTFAKMLSTHREKFSRENRNPPPDFQPLWDRAQTHGIFSARP